MGEKAIIFIYTTRDLKNEFKTEIRKFYGRNVSMSTVSEDAIKEWIRKKRQEKQQSLESMRS